MTQFTRNNLGKSPSPYLQQHKDNPIFWQEWNEETLKYAKKNDKLLFVSIGYATCHWCHVMAREAFSDKETADYINKYFIAIKVDREQRPDIDSYFMDFVNSTAGHGGWPLNVVLDSDAKPFFAGTYFPHKEKSGQKPLKDVLDEVRRWHNKNAHAIKEYSLQQTESQSHGIDNVQISNVISRAFDHKFAGFGTQTKFPPHNTLLLLLNFYQETQSDSAKEMIIKTLDAMSERGLHDHIQGGFYRYCVDREWTIPHFEKMLYDQAMQLWVYSLSFKLFQRDKDKEVIEKLVKNLKETFSDSNGLYYSAHDADTDHIEGDTYVWKKDELKKILSLDEYELFSSVYKISKKGNFEGRNHLIKKENQANDEGNANNLFKIENKLLKERKKKQQPFTDKKIVTSWNALIGIGLLLAYRYTDNTEYKELSVTLFDNIVEKHFHENELAHSSLDDELQKTEFLEDYAAMLLFATYLFEEDIFEHSNKYLKYIEQFSGKIKKFQEVKNKVVVWQANVSTPDFKQIPASAFDHPIPSGKSIAEMALFRTGMLLEKDQKEITYGPFLESDFHNLVAYYSKGMFHELHIPEKIIYRDMPINVLIKKGDSFQDCTDFSCHKFESKEELLNSFSFRNIYNG